MAAGNINATNNVTGSTISASGNITGANFNTAGQVSAGGNITAPNFTGNVRTSAQPFITSLGLLSAVSATGNITSGNVSVSGNVIASNFNGSLIGNVQGNLLLTGNSSEVLVNNSGTVGSGSGLTFDTSTNALSVTGNVNAGNVNTAIVSTSGNVLVGTDLAVSGNAFMNVDTFAVETPVFSTGRNANNQPLVGPVSGDRGLQMYYYSGAERQAFVGYLSSDDKMVAAKQVTVNPDTDVVTVNIYGSFVVGTLESTDVSATGNIISATVSASGNIIGAILSASGNVNGGNVISAALVSGTTVSASGNINGGNVISSGAITASGVISTTGNITGGNILGGANVNATTHTGATVSVTGNINGGNIISAAALSGTSLVISGNTATVTSASYSIGYRDMPQITSLGTLALTDGGKHYYGSGTITVPTNLSVALPIGTTVAIVASAATTVANAAGVTMIWAGQGSAGTRTLAQHAMATLVKVASDTWYISGTGIS